MHKYGYSPENIDEKFLKAAKIKGGKTFEPLSSQKTKQNGRKYYFNTSYDAGFPDIRTCIKKHVSNYFRKAVFKSQSVEPTKNLKEHLTPHQFVRQGDNSHNNSNDSPERNQEALGCWKCGCCGIARKNKELAIYLPVRSDGRNTTFRS